MSLQIAAKHLAAQGRGPDTTLVHMTNKEVQGLQALAEKNGGSLSINPETGLPEAGFLESILPVVAGVGLTAAGMGPMAAALTVGGVSALSTGSLSKGLFAGLGAYGGASLGEQLAVQGMGEAAAANASFGDKLAGMGDASAFSSFENAGKFISANKLPALAGVAGPLLSSMEEDRENDKPPEPEKDTDLGARAKSGIKYNPGWVTPTPLPNPYGIEQTYNRPYYGAEGGATHMAEGGMAYGGSTSIDTKSQFADYLNKVMNPTNRTNAVSGSTNPYDWWKTQSRPEATPAAPPAETPEEYATRMRVNARGAGGSGGMSQEQKDQREADLDRVDDYLSTPENPITMRQYWAMDKEARDKLNAEAAERNPIRGAIYEGVTTLGYPMFLRGLEALQGVVKDFNAPSTKDYKSVGMVFPTENDRIKAEEAAKYRQSLLGSYSGYETPESKYMTNTDPYFNTQLGPGVGTPAYTAAPVETETPSGNFYDAPLSSRTDVSGYPLRESELRSFESGMTNAALSRQMNDIPDALSRQERDVPDLAPIGPYASGRNSNYSEPRTGDIISEVGVPLSINKLVASEKLAASKPIGYDSFTPADASTSYGEGEGNKNKNEIAAFIQQQESIAKDYMDSGVVFGFDHPNTVALKEQYNKFNNVINNLYNRVQYTDPTTNDYKTPFVNYTPDIVGTENEISAAPDDTTLSQFTNAFAGDIALPKDYIGAPIAVLASAADGSTVSDAGNGLGYAMPNMGNVNRGPGLAGISGSFGGLGSAWQGVVGRDGSPVLTSQGAAERAFLSDPNNIALGNEQALQGYTSPLSDPAQRQGQTPDGGGEPSGGGWIGHDADPGDHGYGSTAAVGGLSTPYGFQHMAQGGLSAMANSYDLGSYSDGGRLLKGPGDGVSDSIPATIGKGRPARLADGEFVIPARIVSEIGNGSTDAGARKLYAMMDRIQASRSRTVGKGKVAVNNRADKYLPA